MLGKVQEVAGFARLSQLPRLARRAAGLPFARPDDFFPEIDAASEQRLAAISASIRGNDAPPAIFVHGVLPRSGTNFLADVIGRHRDVAYNPGRLWEFPLLSVAESAGALQKEFKFFFPPNGEVMGRYDMLGYLASGWLRDLQNQNPGKRLLFKSPHVQNIGLFRALFPNDKLVLCLRDGRDVAASSMGTFGGKGVPSKSLRQLASEWAEGCEAILSFETERAHPNVLVARYEDLVRAPEAAARRLVEHAGLDASVYDFAGVAAMPVRGSSTNKVDDSQRWQPAEKPKDFNPIGRWHGWSAAQKQLFAGIAGAALQRAGYQTGA